MISNPTSVVYWQVVTSRKQQQVGIDNVHENAKRVRFHYTVKNTVYVGMNNLYRKIYCKKQVTYKITEFFTNVIVQVQQAQVNKQINIRNMKHHCDE